MLDTLDFQRGFLSEYAEYDAVVFSPRFSRR